MGNADFNITVLKVAEIGGFDEDHTMTTYIIRHYIGCVISTSVWKKIIRTRAGLFADIRDPTNL